MAIEQRIGRIDRIGQTREVFVFNLVTAGTIEDAMLRILDEKINMFELVVGEVGAILGEMDEQQDFSRWCSMLGCRAPRQARADAFTRAREPVAGGAAAIRRRQATRRGALRERARCRLRHGRMQRFVAALLR